MRSWTLAAITAAALVVTTFTPAVAADPLAEPVWLCRPGMAANPCGQDAAGGAQANPFTTHYVSGRSEPLDATTVSGDGTVAHEPYQVGTSAPVDCFYVYPTVDVLPNPLLQVGNLPPTRNDVDFAVTLTQLGRFANVCRLFVPAYRQQSIIQLATGEPFNPDLSLGESDVEQAFLDYWNHDNVDPSTRQHRGFIVLGHSQGSWVASWLIAKDIETDPVMRAHLISAILPGGDVQAPDDQPAGGGTDPDSTFQYLGACTRTAPAQPVPTGCVVAYSSYALPAGEHPDPGQGADHGPGRSTAPGHHVLCTNPAALLAGGSADAPKPLDTYLPTRQLLDGIALVANGQLAILLLGWDFRDDPTGYTHYPGRLQGQCQSVDDAGGNAAWLQVTGDTSLFPAQGGTGNTGLGLHVMDYNVDLGNLVQLAVAQSAAWLYGNSGD